MKRPLDAEYLGDSVYVEIAPHRGVKLMTWNGYEDDPRNVIYLDDSVLRSFEQYLQRKRADGEPD